MFLQVKQSRNSVIKKFYSTLHQLSQTDKLLVHLNSFAANPLNYTMPDTVQKGLPLFMLSPATGAPVPYSQVWYLFKILEFFGYFSTKSTVIKMRNTDYLQTTKLSLFPYPIYTIQINIILPLNFLPILHLIYNQYLFIE